MDEIQRIQESVGTKLSDFKILKELGKGSYGTVYTVRSYLDSKDYVMKKMELNHLKPKQQRECYHEVSILKRLNHPNIIKYYSSFLENENLYIIMEYAENGDLYSIIKHYKRHLKYLEEINIWRIAYEILNGLNYLHTHNIIHRDIKCLNLFITKDKHVKIGDLGVSTIVSSINALHCTRVGTPLYLSPELIKQIPYDYKVDIWSFGCSLYHLCKLDPPFIGDNLISLGNMIVKSVPKPIPNQYSNDLILFIDKLLSKKPEKRPSAKEALNLIPKDIIEKIKEDNKNNVEIKSRPFSSIPNRIVTINKDEIKKIEEKIQQDKNDKSEKNDKNEKSEKEKNEKEKKENEKKEIENLNYLKDKNLEVLNMKKEKNLIKEIFNENKNIKKEMNLMNVPMTPKENNNNLFRGSNQISKFNFNPNQNQNKINLPFPNKINNKQEKSVRVYSKELKDELKDLKKEKTKKSIIEAKEKKIELLNEENINLPSFKKNEEAEKRTLTEEKIIQKKIPDIIEKKEKEKEKEKNENLKEKEDEKRKESSEIKFPNLNQNNQNINSNEFKRILSSNNPKRRIRPYTASNNRILNSKINQNPKTFRPMTGIKPNNINNINNNVINININFFNIDMNKRFLAPHLNFFRNDDYDDLDIYIIKNNNKRPNSNLNLKEITGNANEFFFSKIIKTLEERNGKRKLTINDID